MRWIQSVGKVNNGEWMVNIEPMLDSFIKWVKQSQLLRNLY